MPFFRCTACAAKDAEVAHLRAENAKLLDALLAATAPEARAALHGQGRPITHATDENGTVIIRDGREIPLEQFRDEHGRPMVRVGNESVLADDFGQALNNLDAYINDRDG